MIAPSAIETGILVAAISAVRLRHPWGVHCEVRLPVCGPGAKSGRVIEVRTAWELTDASAAPQLINAYITTG
jgi:hypothetical protein